ncbi:hypothetical protein BDY17DRAFT_30832 [Neohortaea acidophila]|uniref:Uncharacterized protein n=1 Tax=Neohortaea acidophila TaxID=245834 RepID=A0A6A6PKM9_9PEZI|nr:uncharacterized protein BDY17DRAFT_30832 [Neohortaea acidophila]KAF2480053.1 hypothetical protein BDY17DRAFT_30832 [Neohortaea acidophila]
MLNVLQANPKQRYTDENVTTADSMETSSPPAQVPKQTEPAAPQTPEGTLTEILKKAERQRGEIAASFASTLTRGMALVSELNALEKDTAELRQYRDSRMDDFNAWKAEKDAKQKAEEAAKKEVEDAKKKEEAARKKEQYAKMTEEQKMMMDELEALRKEEWELMNKKYDFE